MICVWSFKIPTTKENKTKTTGTQELKGIGTAETTTTLGPTCICSFPCAVIFSEQSFSLIQKELMSRVMPVLSVLQLIQLLTFQLSMVVGLHVLV